MQFTLEQQAEHRSWLVAALRSGDYKQGRNCLRSREGFCCLGVACDVYDKWNMKTNNAPTNWVPIELGLLKSSHTYGVETGFLPSEVRNFFGIVSSNGELVSAVDSVHFSLIGMNDSNGNRQYTFNDIANQIEKGNVIVQT